MAAESAAPANKPADVYMHMPRGSNNRLNEQSANRNNGNRAFDSQVGGVFVWFADGFRITFASQNDRIPCQCVGCFCLLSLFPFMVCVSENARLMSVVCCRTQNNNRGGYNKGDVDAALPKMRFALLAAK